MKSKIKFRCLDCNSAKIANCSDPPNCGGRIVVITVLTNRNCHTHSHSDEPRRGRNHEPSEANPCVAHRWKYIGTGLWHCQNQDCGFVSAEPEKFPHN